MHTQVGQFVFDQAIGVRQMAREALRSADWASFRTGRDSLPQQSSIQINHLCSKRSSSWNGYCYRDRQGEKP